MRNARRRKRRRLRRYLHKPRARIDPRAPLVLGALLGIIVFGAVFDRSGGSDDVETLAAFATQAGREPVDLVVAAGYARPILMLGDVHPSAQAKRLAAQSIEALARGPGLDAVVLEVGADLQPRIDAYLMSDPEDASPLIDQPRAIGQAWGTAHAYLEIYRAVWRLNRDLEPGRRIRIIAADLPEWPPARRLSPAETASRYVRRDAFMAERIEETVLRRDPGARVLIFMNGYHALKTGGAELSFGGGAPVRFSWLGAILAERYPGQLYSILIDAPPRPGSYSLATTQITSRAHEVFRRGLPGGHSFAVPVDARFDFLRRPIRAPRTPGIDVEIRPREARLRDLVDGYIHLGAPRAFARP